MESRSISIDAYVGGRKVDQRVDCALKDVRRSESVDLLGAPGAADVGFDHRPFDRLGRPALVPQQDGKFERREVARKGADRLRSRAVAAVHVERQADDHADYALRIDDSPEAREVLGELGAANGLERSGEMPSGIADRDADGLCADIEAASLPPLGNATGKALSFGSDQRCHAASLLSASRRIAPQKSA